MAQVDLIMPKMGESVAEATIIKWLKAEGDKIGIDEPVLEIATDKVDSEVPSPTAGILQKILFKEGDVVKVGAVLAQIGTDATASAKSSPSAPEKKTIVASGTPVPVHVPTQSGSNESIPRRSSENRFYSPLVRTIAQKEGINAQQLDSLKGSGLGGRVTKNDILSYISQKGNEKSISGAAISSNPANTNGSTSTPVKPAISIGAADEIIEMDRMRKLIADHMVMSKHTSPHVTSYVEVDVTNMVLWREKVKDKFQKRENEKLTFTPIFIEAIVKAIKDFPMINVSLDGTKIIVKKNINIGMATALASGNLIVPVIKNADHKNLIGLTKAVNDLALRARNNKLQPDEIQGGTYTITNVGTFGNAMGTPIINQPQVAIMAVGVIKKKPAVIETPYGDTIGIRHMMYLSHSYDHRIVDGSLGGSFVKKVADYLEQFDINREI